MCKMWIVIVLFALQTNMSAQFRIPFINYSLDNGLLQNQVSGICQDDKGYIWFSTAEGISNLSFG